MKAAFGLRLAAFFAAGFFVTFFIVFLAGDFLAADFFDFLDFLAAIDESSNLLSGS
jgi:hypothetical protein